MATSNSTSTSYTIDFVKTKLSTDQRWMERAIVRMYEENQTPDEQRSEHTKHRNRMGFNGPDSHTLSYYANWIKKGKHLSGKHLEKAFEKMPKYAGQILNFIQK